MFELAAHVHGSRLLGDAKHASAAADSTTTPMRLWAKPVHLISSVWNRVYSIDCTQLNDAQKRPVSYSASTDAHLCSCMLAAAPKVGAALSSFPAGLWDSPIIAFCHGSNGRTDGMPALVECREPCAQHFSLWRKSAHHTLQ